MQTLIAVLIIAVAALYLFGRLKKALSGKSGCGCGCSCSAGKRNAAPGTCSSCASSLSSCCEIREKPGK